MNKQLYAFRKADGKAIGTSGYEVSKEKAGSIIYTGLFKGKKIVALLVAHGAFTEINDQLQKNGEEIVRKLNSHEALVKSVKEMLKLISVCSDSNLVDLQLRAIDALNAAGEQS